MFYDREKNASNIQALSQALANTNRGDVKITPFTPPAQPQQLPQQNNSNALGNLMQVATPLLKTGISKIGGLGNNNSNGIISETTNSFITDTPANDYGLTSAINSEVNGTALNDGSIASAIDGFSGGGLAGIGTGLLKGLGQGISSANDPEKETYLGGIGNGIQGFFGVNDNQSDVEQGINGAINGAMTGTAIFPGIGTAIGGLLGLGSSFIDDIGG